MAQKQWMYSGSLFNLIPILVISSVIGILSANTNGFKAAKGAPKWSADEKQTNLFRHIRSADDRRQYVVCNQDLDVMTCNCNLDCDDNNTHCCVSMATQQQLAQAIKLELSMFILDVYTNQFETEFKRSLVAIVIEFCRSYPKICESYTQMENTDLVIDLSSVFVFSVEETNSNGVNSTIFGIFLTIPEQTDPPYDTIPLNSSQRITLPYAMIQQAIYHTPLMVNNTRVEILSVTRWILEHVSTTTSPPGSVNVKDIIVSCGVLGGLFLTCFFVSCVKAVRDRRRIIQRRKIRRTEKIKGTEFDPGDATLNSEAFYIKHPGANGVHNTATAVNGKETVYDETRTVNGMNTASLTEENGQETLKDSKPPNGDVSRNGHATIPLTNNINHTVSVHTNGDQPYPSVLEENNKENNSSVTSHNEEIKGTERVNEVSESPEIRRDLEIDKTSTTDNGVIENKLHVECMDNKVIKHGDNMDGNEQSADLAQISTPRV